MSKCFWRQQWLNQCDPKALVYLAFLLLQISRMYFQWRYRKQEYNSSCVFSMPLITMAIVHLKLCHWNWGHYICPDSLMDFGTDVKMSFLLCTSTGTGVSRTVWCETWLFIFEVEYLKPLDQIQLPGICTAGLKQCGSTESFICRFPVELL